MSLSVLLSHFITWFSVIFCLLLSLAPLILLRIAASIPQYGELLYREFRVHRPLFGVLRGFFFFSTLILVVLLTWVLSDIVLEGWIDNNGDFGRNFLTAFRMLQTIVLAASSFLFLQICLAAKKQIVRDPLYVQEPSHSIFFIAWLIVSFGVISYAVHEATDTWEIRLPTNVFLRWMDYVVDNVLRGIQNIIWWVPIAISLMLGVTFVFLGRAGIRFILNFRNFALTWIHLMLSLTMVALIPVMKNLWSAKELTQGINLQIDGWKVDSLTVVFCLLLTSLLGVGLVFFLLNLTPFDSREIGSKRTKHVQPNVCELLTQGGWLNSDGVATGKQLIVFVAEGGGIHAANRALMILANLNRNARSPGSGLFWDHVFATSTVSGGSIGTLAFIGLHQKDDYPRPDADVLLYRAALRFNSQDLLLPTLFGLFVVEPLSLFFGFIQKLDRAKIFQHALAVAIQKSFDNRIKLSAEETGILDPLISVASSENPRHSAAGKLLCFQASSAFFGEQVSLSGVRSAKMRTLANLDSANDLNLLEAACLSARFPIITPYGRVRVGGTMDRPVWENFIDGGVVDNSGTDGAMRIIREIRDLEVNNDAKIPMMVVVVGNLASMRTEDSTHIPKKNFPKSSLIAFFRGAVSTLYSQNGIASRTFREFCGRQDVKIAEFRWEPELFKMPLGWYMSRRKRKSIGWILGCSTWVEDEELWRSGEEIILDENYIDQFQNIWSDKDHKTLRETRNSNLIALVNVRRFLAPSSPPPPGDSTPDPALRASVK